MSQMDVTRAAQLIEKWISVYDMDNAKAWERDEYPFIKDTSKAMKIAVQVLRGKSALKGASLHAAASQLLEYVDEYGMDSPAEWEKENIPFVKEVLEAINFTVAVLKK
ncbi:hypothetical protein [Paenibacillus crassostreae]|uniref:Uncharacterized protein n=1 Tax=Paenibacillus crassostreae TaxID=1763538 RepID=A0A167B8F9_9BACL|nr:hypothetical protein [Paenibacillus crassostreae]AOZ93079.1 hypothetical protein LPB68_13230 [Paenibacillus crassostreae]OAB71832.1 hypothetical protein PNBC_17660 [Paenibacillus crassostreae]